MGGGVVAAGHSSTEILGLYPYLEAEDVRAALDYAAWRLQDSDFPLAVA
jgi:uncharacterized protein (DUF433 family)